MATKRKPSLADYFEDLGDQRKRGRNFKHPLENVLIMAVVGIACGQKTFTAIADFVEGQLDWFGKFLDVSKGTPSEDTFRRVFEAIDPEKFERAFSFWTAGLADLLPGEVVAIDGKTIRNSGHKGRASVHLVSAWASSNGLVLGQIATEEKSNEITAIPKLLETLALEGCIVTIDAMGCQREIVKDITEKGAHYVLAVKDNQPTLHEEIKQYFESFRANALPDSAMRYIEQADKGHGRIEVRRCWVTPTIEWFENAADWAGLSSIVMVEAERTTKSKTSTDVRCFISSLPGDDPEQVLNATREHWGIENRLHWVLDVTFGEDKANARLGNLAENFSIARRIALNALRKTPGHKGNMAQTGRFAAFRPHTRDALLRVLCEPPPEGDIEKP